MKNKPLGMILAFSCAILLTACASKETPLETSVTTSAENMIQFSEDTNETVSEIAQETFLLIRYL